MRFEDLVIKKYKEQNNSENFQNLRQECFLKFQKTGIPKSKNEKWKYINVSRFLKSKIDFKIDPTKKPKKFFSNSVNKIVLYNGEIQKDLSFVENKGIVFCDLKEAYKKNHKIINKIINYNKENYDGLCLLNTAFLNEKSLFIMIEKDTKIKDPIEIIHFYDTENEVLINQKQIIYVNKNCEVTINEKIKNLGSKYIFCNSVNEILCEKKSIMDYYKTQNSKNISLIDNNFISQEEKSDFSIHTYTFSGDLIRNNIYVDLKAKNSTANLYGISFLKNKSIVDNYTYIKHLVSNCYSNELYKGIYDDSSRGVFCGKILVDKNAQKTDAFQQNNNILLSNGSSIDSKPQLEIYADDVSCSHGCTIGQIDNNALFYLKTRGIKHEIAVKMLTYGFIYDVLKKCKITTLQKFIKEILLKNKETKSSFFKHEI